MIRLRVLGTLDLSGPAKAQLPALVQPKRLALFAYLVLARPKGLHSRDMLLGLLWPDLAGIRARAALRNALHFIRRELGDAVVVTRGDAVGVAHEAVWCDATAFESALRAGDLEAALDLYGGDLLEGFHVSSAFEFERWLERERGRLHDLARDAAISLTDRSAAEGRTGVALKWARRAVEICGLEEGAVQRLIELLDRAGDRAAAILVYEDFARRLAAELELEPSPEMRSLVDAIRRRGGLPAGQSAVASSPARATGPTTFLVEAAEKALREPRSPPLPHWRRLSRTTRVSLSLAASVLALSALIVAALLGGRPNRETADSGIAPAADRNLIAVLPFRVTSSGSELAYLEEGMVDLLAAALTVDEGPQCVPTRSMLTAWRRAGGKSREGLTFESALSVAAALGAGRMVVGTALGTEERLVLNASLVGVPDGSGYGQATVEGPVDSLPALVRRLTAQLLALDAADIGQRVGSLTGTSLPALKAYLNGKRAYRRGRYEDAVRHFEIAFDLDSTFLLAALELAAVSTFGLATYPEKVAKAREVAWNGRDRLNSRDRAFLMGIIGPDNSARLSAAARLSALEAAANAAPERLEVWYELGDEYFHWGGVLGLQNAGQLASAAFQRALDMDSSFFAPALEHLIEVSAYSGDTVAARAYGELYEVRHPDAESADYYRWRVATAVRDSAALNELRPRFHEMSSLTLRRIIGYALVDGVGLGDAEAAAALLLQREATPYQRATHTLEVYRLYINRGRIAQARSLLPALRQGPSYPRWVLQHLLRMGLYGGGDRVTAQWAATELARWADAPLARDADERLAQYRDMCAVEDWRLHGGDTRTAERTIALLASPQGDSEFVASEKQLCVHLLRALLAAQMMSRPEGDSALAQLDSVGRTGPVGESHINLVVAHLYAAQGDYAHAREAVRRRYYGWTMNPYLASYLQLEGHLAAVVGDREGVIRAYSHYLALRSDADAEVMQEVEQVRVELGRFLDGRR